MPTSLSLVLLSTLFLIPPRPDPVVPRSPYHWSQVTAAAAFPGSYNFPVFTMGKEMWALHPEGGYRSTEGAHWRRTALPKSGLNSGYQKYVVLNGAVYALGSIEGNYLSFRVNPQILRTRDLEHWDVVAATSNLPRRIFYGATVFDGKIWLIGGYDGKEYFNDVWSSPDAVHWTRVVEHAPWSRRQGSSVAVFQGKIWLLGGGMIDGEKELNPNSARETWNTSDGVTWNRLPDRTGNALGGTPVVFDDKLWLMAANRNSTFAPSLLMTGDGSHWSELAAPWSPRGGVAVWVFDNQVYLTGGKYSVEERGTTRFSYSNDVWRFDREH